jgi:hypothetical protein
MPRTSSREVTASSAASTFWSTMRDRHPAASSNLGELADGIALLLRVASDRPIRPSQSACRPEAGTGPCSSANLLLEPDLEAAVKKPCQITAVLPQLLHLCFRQRALDQDRERELQRLVRQSQAFALRLRKDASGSPPCRLRRSSSALLRTRSSRGGFAGSTFGVPDQCTALLLEQLPISLQYNITLSRDENRKTHLPISGDA